MKMRNTSPQAIELNIGCSEQIYFNSPATGHGYKRMEPQYSYSNQCVLYSSSTCELGSADA